MQKAIRGRNFLPKSILVITLGLITSLTGYNVTAQTVTTDPVGFVSETVTQSLSGGAFSALGLPLKTIRSDRGKVLSVAASVIGVGCSTCATTAYGTNSLTQPQYYVEFLDGAGVGRYFAVATNNSTTITLLTGAESLLALGSGGAVASNDTYILHAFHTPTTVFGPASTSPLKAATTVGNADNILVFDTGTQGYITLFPRINGGQTNWFQVGTGNNNTFPILPDEAVFVQRKGAVAQTNILVLGEVRTTNTVSPLVVGFNFVANPFPSGSIISNANLALPGAVSNPSGFKPATTVGVADNLLAWNAISQGYETIFFRINGGQTNWFLVGTGNQNNYNLPTQLGGGFFVQNKTTGGYWKRPLPYAP